jgi:hypothetical protein
MKDVKMRVFRDNEKMRFIEGNTQLLGAETENSTNNVGGGCQLSAVQFDAAINMPFSERGVPTAYIFGPKLAPP